MVAAAAELAAAGCLSAAGDDDDDDDESTRDWLPSLLRTPEGCVYPVLSGCSLAFHVNDPPLHGGPGAGFTCMRDAATPPRLLEGGGHSQPSAICVTASDASS